MLTIRMMNNWSPKVFRFKASFCISGLVYIFGDSACLNAKNEPECVINVQFVWVWPSEDNLFSAQYDWIHSFGFLGPAPYSLLLDEAGYGSI